LLYFLAKTPAFNTVIPLMVEEMSNNADKPSPSKLYLIVIANWLYGSCPDGNLFKRLHGDLK